MEFYVNVQKGYAFILIFSVIFFGLHAQKLSSDEHNSKTTSQSNREKVDYIIDNYFLYSPDLNHEPALTKQAAMISGKMNLIKGIIDIDSHAGRGTTLILRILNSPSAE